MSIEKQIADRIDYDNRRQSEYSKLSEYLNSENVQSLVSKYLESDVGTLIERGDRIRLYLTKDNLEIYEYSTIDVKEPTTEFPFFDKIFYKIKESKVVNGYPSVVATLNGDHSFTVSKLNVCFSVDKLISLLDELLFD